MRATVSGLSAETATVEPVSPPDDRLGLADVAEALDTSRPTAARYVNRPDFPKPVEVRARGRLWRRRDVEKWAAKTLPLQQGRPKQA
jgi:predicted DNA-binding transcriptional regulator AlpA